MHIYFFINAVNISLFIWFIQLTTFGEPMITFRVFVFLIPIFCCFNLVLSATPPNVVIILCDDLGFGDVEGFAYNDVSAKTPALNKMAAEGMKLTHFLVTAPYCSPSRSSLLTGRYPFRTGVVFNPAPDQGIDEGMSQSEFTLGELFKEKNYNTYYVGKWHLGHKPEHTPTTQGFDEYFGILYSNDMRPLQIIHNQKVAEYTVNQALLTEKYTDKSIEYIEQSVKAPKPFFLILSHAMPHRPLAASKKFYTPETPDDLYDDVIRELDFNIGRLMNKLKDLEIDKETLVLFLSDNGANHGGNTGGLRGKKGVTFDGGLRVPFIARWPGTIPQGKTNHSMASGIDLMPTFAKLIGASIPQGIKIDGKDLLPQLISSKANTKHQYLISMKKDKINTIHTEKWKLHMGKPGFYSPPKKANSKSRLTRLPDGETIIAPINQPDAYDFPGLMTGDRSNSPMLFNIQEDPGEQKDLSKTYPEEFKKLKSYYSQIMKEVKPLFIPKASGYIKQPGGQFDYWNIIP